MGKRVTGALYIVQLECLVYIEEIQKEIQIEINCGNKINKHERFYATIRPKMLHYYIEYSIYKVYT
jgi:oligoribonuclease (3'-5' exoribonuclease)